MKVIVNIDIYGDIPRPILRLIKAEGISVQSLSERNVGARISLDKESASYRDLVKQLHKISSKRNARSLAIFASFLGKGFVINISHKREYTEEEMEFADIFRLIIHDRLPFAAQECECEEQSNNLTAVAPFCASPDQAIEMPLALVTGRLEDEEWEPLTNDIAVTGEGRLICSRRFIDVLRRTTGQELCLKEVCFRETASRANAIPIAVYGRDLPEGWSELILPRVATLDSPPNQFALPLDPERKSRMLERELITSPALKRSEVRAFDVFATRDLFVYSHELDRISGIDFGGLQKWKKMMGSERAPLFFVSKKVTGSLASAGASGYAIEPCVLY